MSSNSKGKAIADLLMSDTAKWWGWDDILEGLIPGFSNVPSKIQGAIFESYETYMTHARAELDERERVLLRDGKSMAARWKIATTDPEDKPYIVRVLADQQKRANGINGRIETRVANLKAENILPESWTPALTQ
jgi:hypothetical protein